MLTSENIHLLLPFLLLWSKLRLIRMLFDPWPLGGAKANLASVHDDCLSPPPDLISLLLRVSLLKASSMPAKHLPQLASSMLVKHLHLHALPFTGLPFAVAADMSICFFFCLFGAKLRGCCNSQRCWCRSHAQ
ncbi:hypothetical protein Cni_G11745 [Canna indica]|uniref:Uncharacterized protein n=1 Tax=Canna indica TaxID=4628 RepID=A0AAQ3K6Y3_9LILI|nr:hypothetical protein Cni_G11745 [Canna indica]